MTEDNVDFSLLLDLAKDSNNRLRKMEEDIKDLKGDQIIIREDINGVRGDLIRHERAFAVLESDIDRIKTRLDLSD